MCSRSTSGIAESATAAVTRKPIRQETSASARALPTPRPSPIPSWKEAPNRPTRPDAARDPGEHGRQPRDEPEADPCADPAGGGEGESVGRREEQVAGAAQRRRERQRPGQAEGLRGAGRGEQPGDHRGEEDRPREQADRREADAELAPEVGRDRPDVARAPGPARTEQEDGPGVDPGAFTPTGTGLEQTRIAVHRRNPSGRLAVSGEQASVPLPQPRRLSRHRDGKVERNAPGPAPSPSRPPSLPSQGDAPSPARASARREGWMCRHPLAGGRLTAFGQ